MEPEWERYSSSSSTRAQIEREAERMSKQSTTSELESNTPVACWVFNSTDDDNDGDD